MIQAILIDDERHALDALQNALAPFDQIEVVGRFTNPFEALAACGRLPYQVVFLDIEMPGMKGLEVAETIMEQRPDAEIVFITAYDQYAVEAFEVGSLDYLLKPVRHERLAKTVDKLIARCKPDDRVDGLAECDIVCFGGFRVRVNPHQEEYVKWRTNKVRELFAYLVHHRGKMVHKSRIIEDLWAEMDMERATAYLHTCIYQIRKTIKQYRLQQQLAVQYANDSYHLVMSDIRLDTDELMRLAGTDLTVTRETVDAYERAIALYHGDYLEEDDFVWAEALKQKLLLTYIEMVTQMAAYYMDNSQYTRAILHLKQLISKNPLQEEAHEMLLNAYAAMGDRAMLVDHYSGMEALFFNELGIEPSSSTKALFRRLSGELD